MAVIEFVERDVEAKRIDKKKKESITKEYKKKRKKLKSTNKT